MNKTKETGVNHKVKFNVNIIHKYIYININKFTKMSWFTKNGIYEKVALYCIDKSPLLVDKDKLTCKDGIITMKDVRIDYKIDKSSKEQELSGYDEINGLIESIQLEISSNGLKIEFEGSEFMINGSDPSMNVNQLTEDLMKSVNLMKSSANVDDETEADDEHEDNFKSHSKVSNSSNSISSMNTDSQRQNSMSSIDSFGYTKSVMLDIASSFMGSIEDFKNTSSTAGINTEEEAKKFDQYYDDNLPEDISLDDDIEPPKSLLDSFKNKIIDMMLSNFQIKFANTRILFTSMGMIIDIESMEAKSKENERFLDFYGIKIIDSNNNYKEEEERDVNDDETMMSSSIYMSAMSSFSKNFENNQHTNNENESKIILSLEDISFFFISNNDPKKFIPQEIMVSPFTVEYDDMKFQVESFNILISKSINKYTFKINEFTFELHSETIDKNGYKIELVGIEYGNFVKNQHTNESIPTFDTLTVQKFKISHKHLNFSSKKSKSGNEAIIIIFKNNSNDRSIEFKFKTLELVAKTYRINSGVILKIPRIFATYHNNKLKGAIKTFSISLIESFKNLNTVNDAVVVDNISFQFVDKTLNLNIDEMLGNFCCDSFHCFIQTMMDISYTESFPDNLKYEREVNSKEPPLNLKDILLGEDFFDANLLFKSEDIIDSVNGTENNNGFQTEKKFKLKKNFLSDLINKKVNKPSNRTDLKVFNDPLSKFNLNLQLETLSLKMFEGYHFDYTKNLIKENILNSTKEEEEEEKKNNDDNEGGGEREENDGNGEVNEAPNILFNSIYIPYKRSKTNPINIEKSGYLEEFVFGKRNLPFLGKSQKHSGELVVDRLEIKFENLTPDFLPTQDLKKEDAFIMTRFCLSAKNLDILDNVESSNFNKFLTSFKSPQLDHSCFAHNLKLIDFELENVRPDPHLLTSEFRMGLKTLPLKLHINEDFVDFLMRFFTFNDPRFELIDEYPEEVFIQKFEIASMNISIDYKSKETKANEENEKKIKSIFLNTLRSLIVVENCDIKLKHLIMYAIDSGDDIGRVFQDKWLNDIVSSQRLALMGGVSPLKSAMNLSSAVKTLIEQPIQQASNVGWTRSLQNGLLDFGKTTTNELLKLGVNISGGTQNILEATETSLIANNSNNDNTNSINKRNEDELLQKSLKMDQLAYNDDLIGNNITSDNKKQIATSSFSSSTNDKRKRVEIKQPETFKEGLSLAYSTLGNNFNIALKTAISTSKDLHQTENNSEAAKLFLNNMGVTFLRPLIGASDALNKSFQGLQGQLQDEELTYYINQKLKDKYKH